MAYQTLEELKEYIRNTYPPEGMSDYKITELAISLQKSQTQEEKKGNENVKSGKVETRASKIISHSRVFRWGFGSNGR